MACHTTALTEREKEMSRAEPTNGFGSGGNSSSYSLSEGNLSWLSKRMIATIKQLVDAFRYAADLGDDVWQFSMDYGSLREQGLTAADVRWMLKSGLVDRAVEVPDESSPAGRVFVESDSQMFSDLDCFVLSNAGYAAATAANLNGSPVENPVSSSNDYSQIPWRRVSNRNGVTAANGVEKNVPEWDRDRQELRAGNILIKRFKAPAPNQEAILAAFEEENWPTRIDDPLPPRVDLDPKRRLHDTINSLNRNQKSRLVRFFGDGSGEGVRWEFVHASD